MEGHWKFLGEGGSYQCMKINQNFLGGGGMQNKKPFVGVYVVWIFSGTAHFLFCLSKSLGRYMYKKFEKLIPGHLEINFYDLK